MPDFQTDFRLHLLLYFKTLFDKKRINNNKVETKWWERTFKCQHNCKVQLK